MSFWFAIWLIFDTMTANLIEFWHVCRAHEPHNFSEKGFDWRFLTPEVFEMSGYIRCLLENNSSDTQCSSSVLISDSLWNIEKIFALSRLRVLTLPPFRYATSANPRQIWPWPQCQAEQHMWRGLFPAAPVTVPARLLSAEGQLAGNFSTFSHPESPESNRPPSITHHLSHTRIHVLSQQPFSVFFWISLPFSVFYDLTLQTLHLSITETYFYLHRCLFDISSPFSFTKPHYFEILIVSVFLLARNINLQVSFFSLSLSTFVYAGIIMTLIGLINRVNNPNPN